MFIRRSAMISMFTITVSVITCLAALFSVATADMYQYTDKSGTVCMTNDLAKVPPAKRNTVKILRETPKPKPAPPAANSTSVQPPEPALDASPAAAPRGAEATRRPATPWLKILGTALAAVALLLVMLRLCRALSSPQLAKVIYVAFFLGIFVLGYKLYTDHLVNGYFAIKQKMLSLFAKAQQRERLIQPRPRSEEKEP